MLRSRSVTAREPPPLTASEHVPPLGDVYFAYHVPLPERLSVAVVSVTLLAVSVRTVVNVPLAATCVQAESR